MTPWESMSKGSMSLSPHFYHEGREQKEEDYKNRRAVWRHPSSPLDSVWVSFIFLYQLAWVLLSEAFQALWVGWDNLWICYLWLGVISPGCLSIRGSKQEGFKGRKRWPSETKDSSFCFQFFIQSPMWYVCVLLTEWGSVSTWWLTDHLSCH